MVAADGSQIATALIGLCIDGYADAGVARRSTCLPKMQTVCRHIIPAALIGRLARDERVRDEGVGDLLLADAVRRVIGASRWLAVFAIVVEATDEKTAAFYRDFGFTPFPHHPR